MSIVRIAWLAATCAAVFVEPAFAGPTVGVPGPIVGAGIPGLIAAGVAVYAWHRRKRQ